MGSIVLFRGLLKAPLLDPRYRSGVVMECLEVRRVLSAGAELEIGELVELSEDPAIFIDDTVCDTSEDPGDLADDTIMIELTSVEEGGDGEVIDDWVYDDSVIDDSVIVDDPGSGDDGVVDDGEVVDEPVGDGETVDFPILGGDDDLILYKMAGGIPANQRDVELTAAGEPSAGQGDANIATPLPVESGAASEQPTVLSVFGPSDDDVTEDGSGDLLA